MMAAGGNSVDHSIVHLWALKLLPVLEKASRICKWAVGRSWRMDATYIRIRGRIILGSIAFIHMIVEGQMKDGGIAQPLAYQLYSLVACAALTKQNLVGRAFLIATKPVSPYLNQILLAVFHQLKQVHEQS
jgi:hypothetical protein